MGNVEKIELDGIEFKVFRRIPMPIARPIQIMMVDMMEDYTGSIEELESGAVKPRDAKNIKLDILFEIYDLLLTKAVISPPIKKENIDDINDPLQFCFQDLGDLLFEKFIDEKKKIKKKSMNSPS